MRWIIQHLKKMKRSESWFPIKVNRSIGIITIPIIAGLLFLVLSFYFRRRFRQIKYQATFNGVIIDIWKERGYLMKVQLNSGEIICPSGISDEYFSQMNVGDTIEFLHGELIWVHPHREK